MSIWKYFFLFIILSYNSFGQGLKTNGYKIVDHNENEVILRSQNYYQFIIRLTFLFAITFQLPLITLFLPFIEIKREILNGNH